MTEIVLFAEFDIAKGSTLRASSPNVFPQYIPDSIAEIMLPDGVHNRQDDFTVFFLNRKFEPINGFNGQMNDDQKKNPFLYCLSVVRTKYDTNLKRGATVRAVALCSRHQFYYAFKQVLDVALDKLLETSNSQEILNELYNVINSMNLSRLIEFNNMKRKFLRRSIASRSLGGFSKQQNKALLYETELLWCNEKIPISMQVCDTMDKHGNVSLIQLVRAFGVDVMDIYNAVLTGSRVIMLGYNQPAGEVCNYVLSTSALISPPICGLIHRLFPYANLTDLGFLAVPGYVAGVTNPMFKQKPEWWDILCDMSTGEVFHSTLKREIDGHEATDSEFIAVIIEGIKANLSEEWVCYMFEEYTTKNIMEIAFDEADFVDRDTHASVIAVNHRRITKWSQTNTYRNCVYLRGELNADTSKVVSLQKDLNIHMKCLKSGEILSDDKIERIYADFVSHLTTEADFQTFLAYLPDEDDYGLHSIAQGLFHPYMSVRYNTAILLTRMESFPSTKYAVENLNSFMLVTYYRVLQFVKPAHSNC